MNYTTLLSLAYFNQFKKNYILSDLIAILGIDSEKLDNIIENMESEGMLEYKDYLLQITEKGQRVLVGSNMSQYDFDDDSFVYTNIDTTKAWSLDRPYVPEKFDTKYKR